MKNRRTLFLSLCAAVGMCWTTGSVQAQTSNTVTVSGFSYVISGNGGVNPTLTLFRGVTYIFNVSALGHPFFIKTNITDGSGGVFTTGVSNNGQQNGPVTFNVPATAPNQLFYNCSVHSLTFGMHGTLNIVNPPAPPSGQIVLITLSPNLVTMKSIGNSSWRAVPEYSSNFSAVSWTTVPSFTNVFINGTNTTTFGRLDAICGSNVFLRIHSKFP